MKKRLTMILGMLLFVCGMSHAQMQVTGTVVFDNNEPAMGASVLVVGANTGVLTDANGKFSVSVPEGYHKLRFSFVGYETQELTARPRMTVTLKDATSELDEQIVLGYGSARKLGTFSGAIATVGSQKLEMPVTPNFTDALAGQVSGLSVLSSSGEPTAMASIRLRGVNSIESSNTPLFILDGAPISSTLFNTLNPSDIASITVIKDASGTALYGSRAANGVIVITSKKGHFGEKANVTLRAQYGVSTAINKGVEMMSSKQYIKFRDMIGQPVSDDIRNLVENYGISTNWYDEIFKTAPTYSLDATITGGSENTSYYLSLNHHDQDGIVNQSGMKRDAIRFNIDARVNPWLRVGLQSNIGVINYDYNTAADGGSTYFQNPMLFAMSALPYDSPRYYTIDEATGKITWGGKADKLYYSGLEVPEYFTSRYDVDRKSIEGTLNAYEQLTPFKGFTFTARQAMDAYDYTESVAAKPIEEWKTPMGQTVNARDAYASTSFTRYYRMTSTNTAEYKWNIDRHYFTALAGHESMYLKSRSFGVITEGQTDERQLRLTDGTKVSIDDLTDTRAEETFNSFFLSLNYNWNERYFLDASFRTDGSSCFAPDHRWGQFWSIGGMWDIKKESFMKSLTWLNDLKLRVNYGTAGNSSGVGSYDHFGKIGTGSNYNGEASLGISTPSNSDLTWETTASFDAGLTFRIFNRATFNVDFYNKKTSDMLMTIPYSYTTGFSGGVGNIGAMVNRGVDIDVDLDILRTKDINWTFKANFNYNHNEITELFAGRDEYVIANTGMKLQVGKPYGEFYYVRYAGVDSRDGKPMWYDKDGNLTKVYNAEENSVFLGKNRFAPLSGGFGSAFRWKDLTVSFDVQWQAKKYMISNDLFFQENALFYSENQTTRMLNIWTKPGDVTDIPAYGESVEFDSHLVENASFLRLKNITVQYLLPKTWVKRTNCIEQVKLFGIARNLFTITNFTGYDPEVDSNLVQYNYPNTRQFVIGLEVTF